MPKTVYPSKPCARFLTLKIYLVAANVERGRFLIFLFAAVDHADLALVTAVFEARGRQRYPEHRGTIAFEFERLLSAWHGLAGFVAFVVKNAPLHVNFAAVVRDLRDCVDLIAGLKGLGLILSVFVSTQLQTADVRGRRAARQHHSQQHTQTEYQVNILTHLKFSPSSSLKIVV